MKTVFSKSRMVSMWLGLLVLTSQAVSAQSPVSLQSKVETERMVKQTDGQMVATRLPVKSAVPGEEVIFTNTFSNAGKKPADKLVLTNPIAADLRLTKAWGDSAVITYSVDGGKVFGAAETLQVKGADGKMRAAKPEDFTHVRWVMRDSLAVGASAAVGFNAQVR
jgi:uncharacterized repeat protein (TIGR01451 family)